MTTRQASEHTRLDSSNSMYCCKCRTVTTAGHLVHDAERPEFFRQHCRLKSLIDFAFWLQQPVWPTTAQFAENPPVCWGLSTSGSDRRTHQFKWPSSNTPWGRAAHRFENRHLRNHVDDTGLHFRTSQCNCLWAPWAARSIFFNPTGRPTNGSTSPKKICKSSSAIQLRPWSSGIFSTVSGILCRIQPS
jgi:hypothetical protein